MKVISSKVKLLLEEFASLKELQIFEEKYFKRRASDIGEDLANEFINLAFKATNYCEEGMGNIAYLDEKLQKIQLIKKSFADLINENKNKEQYRNKNIISNQYVILTQNLILSSELLLTEKELELRNNVKKTGAN